MSRFGKVTEGISEVESSGGERFTVKQLERTKKSLEARLEKLQAEGRKDDVVTFEQLGVDRLFVDEAHNYKNLFLYTKMRNVAGLSTTDAQKSSDMFAKCRYMDEITGQPGRYLCHRHTCQQLHDRAPVRGCNNLTLSK